ncbi:hypothetical protein FSARC_5456 [Fusarium sarcochroum]|uniref:Heterokaryon incompatibility domain-containing protein n=1 Tax=Fusarium sarcochroum TaxID=1208366 RepID=A0A8H4TZU6_9HYPO|nr:hypothetical protein FSARC_5456 [Fusarium sarcochroum]
MGMTYPPLSGDSIRILDFNVSWDCSDPLCNFRVVSLNDPPDYTAISYCWGDSTEIARIKSCDGGSVPLSQTLLGLFESLKKQYSNFSVWVDAICIDQANTREKESQIPLMGKVYSSAKEVLVWLGDSNDNTKKAFSFMNTEETNDSGLEQVLLLLQRPWFQRVWVIQEAASGTNIQIGCGDDRVGFNRFSDCISAIWNSFTGLARYYDYHPAILGLWCVTRLIDIREKFQTETEKGRGVCYETLLQAVVHCQATRNCDKVFALQSIADSRPVPKPNYRISEEQVFIKTAEALLCNGASLDLLALCWTGDERQQPSLPTWVPDLRCHIYAEPLVLCDFAGWNAGGTLQISPQIEAEPAHRLRLQAKLIDLVDLICPPFQSTSITEQRAAIEAVWALRLRMPGNVSEKAWMARLMSTLIMGIDIDDKPLESGMPRWDEYLGYFTEWFEWISSSSCRSDLRKIEANEYHRTTKPRIDAWKVFATRQGFLCVGPEDVEKGDVVCTVPGCRVPLVLRPDLVKADDPTETDVVQTWTLVSWCFIDGLMFGEAAKLEKPFEEVLLR